MLRVFKAKYAETFAMQQLPRLPHFMSRPRNPSLHLNLAQANTESPKIALCPVFNSTFQANIVLLLICNLDPFQMFRLPVESHQSANEQIVAVFGRFGQRLM